jgi:ribonuclease P protein component
VLVAHPQDHPRETLSGESEEAMPTVRVGVAAGRSIGTAVDRNYAKRRMREAIRPLLPYIHTGWDVLLLARRPQKKADFPYLQTTIKHLLRRAKLLKET